MPIYEAECKGCGYKFEWFEPTPTDITRSCPKCGGEADRLFSRYSPKFFEPFVTRNIDPDGRPIHVKSQKQLSHLCNEHKLVHLDDPNWKPAAQKFPDIHKELGVTNIPGSDAGVVGGVRKEHPNFD